MWATDPRTGGARVVGSPPGKGLNYLPAALPGCGACPLPPGRASPGLPPPRLPPGAPPSFSLSLPGWLVGWVGVRVGV
eukprot:12919321-Prorocentrum_lima.AAC.1